MCGAISTMRSYARKEDMRAFIHLQKLAALIILLGGSVDYVARIIKDEEYHIMLLKAMMR